MRENGTHRISPEVNLAWLNCRVEKGTQNGAKQMRNFRFSIEGFCLYSAVICWEVIFFFLLSIFSLRDVMVRFALNKVRMLLLWFRKEKK